MSKFEQPQQTIENQLRRSNALLKAQQEASIDGILVADEHRNIVDYNQKFCEIWRLPEVLPVQNSRQVAAMVMNQLADPQGFLAGIEALYQNLNEVFHDELLLKDGRTIERHSKAIQSPTGEYYGRITFFRDITERKNAEEALRRSEGRYRAFLSATAQAVWLTNAQGEVEEDIPLWCALTGRSEASAKGWGWLDSVHPDDRESTAHVWQEAVRSGTIYEVEQRVQVASGEYRLFAVRGVPIFDEQGKIREWIGTQTDITEKKKSEAALQHQNELVQAQKQALQAKEAQYQSIFEAVTDGLFITEIETTNLVEVNPAAHQMHGYTYEEFLALHPSAFIHPSSLPVFQDYLETISSGQQFYGQAIDICKDGSLIDVEVQGTICSYKGKPHILGIVQDISDRKAAEAALERRANFDHLLSYVSGQFIDQDLEVAVQTALESIAHYLGAERGAIFEYDPDHSRCQLVYEWCGEGIKPLTPEARGSSVPEYPLLHQQFLAGQALYTADIQTIPEGPERRLFMRQSIQSVLGVPVIYRDQVTGFLGIDTVHFQKDWTQEDVDRLKLMGELIAIGRARHKAEADLRIAKQAAEAANLAKSTFLANMSHELRTPLNAILGFSQLMERDTALSEQQRDSLAIINRSGEHLLNLINDVLEMSKIEAGRASLSIVSFDLHHLLQTLQDMFLVRAKTKELTLNFIIAPHLPRYVQTDENKLRQVLINLLSNAMKFTDSGSITLEATVQSGVLQSGVLQSNIAQPDIAKSGVLQSDMAQSKTILQFKVQDTGQGIAPNEFDQLFRPFIQTKSGSQLREGTGLGLTISRRFVRLMGGDIQIESVLGQGSTFSFDIQIAIADAAEVAPVSNPQRVLQLLPNQPNYRILIVDDRPENREFVEQLLTLVGFETCSATNGEDAIVQWQQWRPHLTLMDMRMPVMDGYEATRQIRALESDQTRSKILALTASAFEEQRASILAAGCDDLLAKPFRESHLFEKLAEHLGVSYLYEETTAFEKLAEHLGMNYSSTGVAIDRSLELTRSMLDILPPAWVAQLHQAALAVDADHILQLIQQIPASEHRIAIALTTLVQQFCFDEIIELSQRA